MSLLPLLFSNWRKDLERPRCPINQNIGIVISPETLPNAMELYNFTPLEASVRCPMRQSRPWNDLVRKENSGATSIKADKDKFIVHLDVQQFTPDEVNVKIVDQFVIVEGKHEEIPDEHGWVSRQFTRKYIIPEECDIDRICVKLSSDGVLSIVVPHKQKSTSEGETESVQSQ